MVTEEQLLEKLRVGNEAAVGQWYSRYYKPVLSIASSRIESSQDVEEVVQQTFINCLRQIGFFRGKSSLLTWMTAVLNHEIADYYRKKYAKKALKTLPLSEIFLVTPFEEVSEVSDKVRRVLKTIQSEYAELLQQKYVDKKKVVTIARELGKTVKAVESDLFRARQAFKGAWIAEKYE